MHSHTPPLSLSLTHTHTQKHTHTTPPPHTAALRHSKEEEEAVAAEEEAAAKEKGADEAFARLESARLVLAQAKRGVTALESRLGPKTPQHLLSLQDARDAAAAAATAVQVGPTFF